MKKLYDHICESCGSNDVYMETTVTWDAEQQEWLPGDFSTKGNCNNCGLTGIDIEMIQIGEE